MKYDKLKISSNRSFGVVFFIFFLIVSFFPLIKSEEIRFIPLIISIIFLVLGLLNSKLLSPLNKLWFKFGIFLGNLISPIVMAFVYFFVITPISFLLKIFGKDVLNVNKNDSTTYWIEKSGPKSKMKNQF